MTDSEITLSVLREIRDAVHANNARIDALDHRLSARIDALDSKLSSRIDALEHVVRDAAEQLVFLTRYTKNVAEDLRERVSRLEAKT